jgi:Thioredoxin domain
VFYVVTAQDGKILVLDIKILGYRTDQTFAIRRAVAAALDELQKEQPGITSVVTNIKDAQDILQYTQVLMAPGLVVNGKLVYLCLGRIPKKEQVIGWLRDALESRGG